MLKSTTTKSLFLKDESSFGRLSEIAGALHLVTSQNALDCLAREINEIARRARVSRQTALCSKASSAVLCLPVSQGLRSVAEFYASLFQQAHPLEFRSVLERKVGSAEPEYLARIIQEVACSYDGEGNLAEALRYYMEAAKAARGTDSLIAVQAATNIAVIRSELGDHHSALHELQRLLPIIRSVSHTYPHIYYEQANNLAVVLSRSGRIEEARRAVQIALASPLAPRFPEWQETAREIEEAARSEPHRSAPALKIAAAASPVRHKQKSQLLAKRPRRIAVIGRAKFDLTSTEVPLRFSSRNVVSLLDRYVKTVRIRDRP